MSTEMAPPAGLEYVSSTQAARILKITYVGVAQLARQGKIPAVKVANRWLIPRAFIEEFARTYEGKRGRPRRPDAMSPGLGAVAADAPASEPAKALPSVPAAAPAEIIEPGREAIPAFKVSAEVYHVDTNYQFEVYEKGQITDQARIIVARLKPLIPSLPQFAFRWDYRYHHLNIDIQGVEPSVLEWWTTGKNGYTGHLPRRLPGDSYAFEAVIWLPVTFVFRGRVSILGGGAEEAEGPSSTAATTGGFKRLWRRWSGGTA